ncbi:hypothetical protein FKG94_03655 [Exilibacterium tricleocarpae]|uniref:DUF3313 domain-containing protein n=1 Tax=Exilibacterium tricleocarpae TaxID=2591008 RepID=A0A545U583_9GAMM|nr:hypothetical protein [Exilibacterium tricleocarpae]TQV84629.1 hypothetical protein FKG94_03655 [Exilibacterium tricleocarpae]
MRQLNFGYLLFLAMALSLAGCSSQVVKTTANVPVMQETGEIAEDQLLDVGIMTFDAGLDDAADSDDVVIFPEIRKAESRFIAVHLMETMQSSAAWGAVRVIPNEQSAVDVTVDGVILQSDGESLVVEVTVRDATGREWFQKEYRELASRYAYDPKRTIKIEPFQNLYNKIANDILIHRRTLEAADIRNVRLVSELKFARSFSPDAFGDHLGQDKQGQLQIKRLPSENDPMLDRIRSIRERDYLFVDTLQDYYGTFVKEMAEPYKEWRRLSYREVMAVRDLKKEARAQTIAGVVAILGGIAAAGSDNRSARSAGTIAVAGGGYLIKGGFDKRAEAQIHVEALQELGDSLEADIEPQVIELEDRTITLSGSVENQYNQWRELLRDLYRLDTGGVDPSAGEQDPEK